MRRTNLAIMSVWGRAAAAEYLITERTAQIHVFYVAWGQLDVLPEPIKHRESKSMKWLSKIHKQAASPFLLACRRCKNGGALHWPTAG